MKKTRIGIKDIRFSERTLPDGTLQIIATFDLHATSQLHPEINGDRFQSYLMESKKGLINLMLKAAYQDVWDLAHYAEILLRDQMPARFHFQMYEAPETDPSIFQILRILSQIGIDDDNIETVLEPYRNPEGRSKR